MTDVTTIFPCWKSALEIRQAADGLVQDIGYYPSYKNLKAENRSIRRLLSIFPVREAITNCASFEVALFKSILLIISGRL